MVVVSLRPKSSFEIVVCFFEISLSLSLSLSNFAIMALIFWPGVRILELGESPGGDAERVERGVEADDIVRVLVYGYMASQSIF